MRNQWTLIALACLVLLSSTTVKATQSIELKNALEQLRVTKNEWRREDATFRNSRRSGKLSKSEQEDYAEFVAGLQLKVLIGCEEARKLGAVNALLGDDCAKIVPNQSIRLIAVSRTKVQTEEEKQKILESRLNALESEIDETLLKRQQEIRKKASNSSASRSSGSSGGGKSSQGGSRGADSKSGTRTANKSSASSGIGVKTKGNQQKPNSGSINMSQPKKPKRKTITHSGSDDDVVVRQLREAAEKETDPVLKEKLWEEYSKYKRAKK